MRLTKLRDSLHVLILKDFDIWFSYETPIAFQRSGEDIVIRENMWGRTTGKHINYLKEKTHIQLKNDDFEEELINLF